MFKLNFKPLERELRKRFPTIMTAGVVIGAVATAYFTHEATKKAVKKMEEVEITEESKVERAKQEFKTTWRYYIKPAASLAVTVACAIGADRINVRRIAELTDAIHLSETLASRYKDKVKEVVGEKKEHKIKTAMEEQFVHDYPPCDENITVTGDGNVLFKDYLTGRYFYSSVDKVLNVKAELKGDLNDADRNCVSLNALWFALNIEELPIGDLYGWDKAHVGKRSVDFDLIPVTAPDGRPCHCINYEGRVTLLPDSYDDYGCY